MKAGGINRVLTVVGFVAAAWAGVVVIRLLGPSNAHTLAWMLRELIFQPLAILLVLAAWFWRSRFPVAWTAVRWFYGITWTLFGLNFLLLSGGLTGIAVVGGIVLLASLWKEWTNRRRTLAAGDC